MTKSFGMSKLAARAILATGLAAGVAAGCGPSTHEAKTPPSIDPVPNDVFGDSATQLVALPQGWSPTEAELFYSTPQGSDIMSYDIFLNLEQATGTTLFRDNTNMLRFRYITEHPSAATPDGLPVGFVKSKDKVGLTCAACHTTQLNYKGTGIIIDGGPAMADFSTFMDELIAALGATLGDPAKLGRLVARVNKGTASPSKETIGAELQATFDKLLFAQKVNQADKTPYGYARLDAFGRIFNRALTLADPVNGNPASGPVSYPFLWDASFHDYVQWNGIASNANLGSLQRNIGEVIGVFGDIVIDTSKVDIHGYQSSVETANLIKLEEQLRSLYSPQWPDEILPPIDPALRVKGEGIYMEQCVQCHFLIDRTDPKRVVRAQMYGLDIVKTDPTTAQNIVNAAGKSGVLEGQKLEVIAGPVFGPDTTAFLVVTNIVAGILENNIRDSLKDEIDAIRNREGGGSLPKQGDFPRDPNNPDASLLAYKARPLNGIWATAPFLHNGSVPTLYDLMLPAEQRPRTFWVGKREFDAAKVGIMTARFEGGFEFDVSLPGNSNAGHEYGGELSQADRMALLEYLKSL